MLKQKYGLLRRYHLTKKQFLKLCESEELFFRLSSSFKHRSHKVRQTRDLKGSLNDLNDQVTGCYLSAYWDDIGGEGG